METREINNKFDIDFEINILTERVNKHLLPYLKFNYGSSKPFTYSKKNYVITFPFNFSIYKNNETIKVIRELALLNAIYVKYFFLEDDVLDEYNLSINEYREKLILMCEGHIFRNIGIERFIAICGNDILYYLNSYEEKFYGALISEKINTKIKYEHIIKDVYEKYLCYKVMPLCSVFAAYCLIKGQENKINLCENMIINFQTASQIIDDLKDLHRDSGLPDKSALIKAYEFENNIKEVASSEIKKYIVDNGIAHELIDRTIGYLEIAKQYSRQLNFALFERDIDNYLRITKSIKINL